MTKWQKILAGIGTGLLALSTVVPGVQLVTLPIIGAVGLKAALVTVATFVGGVAVRTPGHAPVSPKA